MDPNKRRITDYVRQLQGNLDGNNWLDENYQNKLENVDAEQVFTRPLPEIHSVAELVAHVLIWRKESIKRLTGIQSELTADHPENWRNNDELKTIGWRRLKNELFESQEELIELLKQKQDHYLTDNQYTAGYSYQFLIEGLIHHDIYHLGQIGITTKLLRLGVSSPP